MILILLLSEFIFTIKGLNVSVNLHFAFIRRWGLFHPWKIDIKFLKRVQMFPVAVCFLWDFSNTAVILLFPNDMKRVVQIPSTACCVSALAHSLWKGVSIESGQCLQANHHGERNGLIYSSNWLFCTQLGDLSNFFSKVCGECVCVWCYRVLNATQLIQFSGPDNTTLKTKHFENFHSLLYIFFLLFAALSGFCI